MQQEARTSARRTHRIPPAGMLETEAELTCRLTNARAVIEAAIRNLTSRSGTHIDKGLRLALAELQSPRHLDRNLPVMILLTDGVQTGTPGEPQDRMQCGLGTLVAATPAGFFAALPAWLGTIVGNGLVLGILLVLPPMLHLAFRRSEKAVGAWLGHGFLDEWDYWAGSFGLVVCAMIEVILFMWVFGAKKAWHEIHLGADIRIPHFFKHIMTWVTPLYLAVILVWWGKEDALPIILNTKSAGSSNPVVPADEPYIWASRLLLVAIALARILTSRRWRLSSRETSKGARSAIA